MTTLLWKDWLQVWRNPWSYLIMLALPLGITAVIGMTFGGAARGGSLGKIKIALVDEDQQLIGTLISGALGQGQFKDLLSVRAMSYDEAIATLKRNELSAVVRVPMDFSQHFLHGDTPFPLEIVKNPAQSFYPAIVEEIFTVIAEALDAIARNLNEELPTLAAMLEEEGRFGDLSLAASFLTMIDEKITQVDPYVNPFLLKFVTEERESTADASSPTNLFVYLLPAISALFLLFIADMGMRDLFKENRTKTLARYCSLRANLLPLILSKVLFSAVLVFLGCFLLFLIGGLIFNIDWQAPHKLAVLVLAFGWFAAGALAMLVAIVGEEKKADVFNGIILMAMGFLGGSLIPANNLPAGVRNHIAPLMPNYWFSHGILNLQLGWEQVPWLRALGLLLIIGLICTLIATFLLQRRLQKGFA